MAWRISYLRDVVIVTGVGTGETAYHAFISVAFIVEISRLPVDWDTL
jgi:hypothetical protein